MVKLCYKGREVLFLACYLWEKVYEEDSKSERKWSVLTLSIIVVVLVIVASSLAQAKYQNSG